MSEEKKPFQFTIGRMMHATAWLGMSAALMGVGYRFGIREVDRGRVWSACCFIAAVPFGGGIGAIFGRPVLGAWIALGILSLITVAFGLQTTSLP